MDRRHTFATPTLGLVSAYGALPNVGPCGDLWAPARTAQPARDGLGGLVALN